METPQFSAKDRHEQNSQSSFNQEILRAPKKNQTKKTLQIKKNIILTSEVANELRKINFNDSPMMNQYILMHARVFQEKNTPQTPIKSYRDTFYDNNLFEEKESTVVQSTKRKFIERDYHEDLSNQQQMTNENISNTEKKLVTSIYKEEYECQDSKKKLKPLLPFKSSIKFPCKKSNQFSAFNLFRDKEIHSNISRFPQNFKKQEVDYDCSSEDDRTEDQIIFMSEEIIKELQNNQNQQFQDINKRFYNQ